MAKVRRASPKSSPPPPPPLQHRAKWRPNAKHSLAHFARYFTPRTDCPSLGVAVAVPHKARPPPQPHTPLLPYTPTCHHIPTHPPSPPSPLLWVTLCFQIVFVLLLPPSPFFSITGLHTPHPPLPCRRYLLKPGARHFNLSSGAPTLCQSRLLPAEACGER